MSKIERSRAEGFWDLVLRSFDFTVWHKFIVNVVRNRKFIFWISGEELRVPDSVKKVNILTNSCLRMSAT